MPTISLTSRTVSLMVPNPDWAARLRSTPVLISVVTAPASRVSSPIVEAIWLVAARVSCASFFTSAATTIGGFAVLIGSAMPLLRDFGIIVTMNVTVALLAALVVMPPLLMYADDRGFFPVEGHDPKRAVRLAAHPTGARLGMWVTGVVVVSTSVARSNNGTASVEH